MSDTVDLGFTPRQVPRGAHLCYLFGEDAERLEVVRQFFRAGAAARESLVYVLDHGEAADIRREVGVGDALDVWRSTELNGPPGCFVAEETYARLREAAARAAREGRPSTRVVGEMDWAARGLQGTDALFAYEAALTEVLREAGITGVCVYDLRLFDGPAILDVLSVHPWAIVRGQLFENPFYVPARTFVERRRALVPEHAG